MKKLLKKLERTILSRKRKRKKRLTAKDCSAIRNITFVIFLCMLFGKAVSQSFRIMDLEQQLNNRNEIVLELTNQLVESDICIEGKDLTIKSLKQDVENQKQINNKLDESLGQVMNDNIELSKQFDSLKADYDILKERKELYDKYSYSLVHNNHERTDLTYDQLKRLDQLSKEAGISTHLPLAIGCVESEFDSDLRNSESSATGSWQFLSGTGKFTYETLLNNGEGTYSHDMATDNNISLEMAVAYLKYLKDTRGTGYKIIQGYSGSPEPSWYIERMNRYLSEVGLTFDDITR